MTHLKIGIDARLAFRRGVGTYVAQLIQALAALESRHQFFIFNAPEELKKRINQPSFDFIQIKKIQPAYYEQVQLPRLAQSLKLDGLHYVDNSAPIGGITPFVVTLHDTMFLRPLSEVRPRATWYQRLSDYYRKWVIPRGAKKARLVLTISQFSKNEIIEKLAISEKQIKVIAEGVDRSQFPPRRFRTKRSKIPQLLIQGASDSRKNVATILKTLQWLKQRNYSMSLKVIGMDQKELQKTDYPRQAYQLGIASQVQWLGWVESSRLAQLYAESDIFVYPSKWEGFGLPVLESFACGTPVITSQTTSLPEVAGEAALLVDPESPESIGQAILKIIQHPAMRRHLVQKGFRRLRLFSWHHTACQTLLAYQEAFQ